MSQRRGLPRSLDSFGDLTTYPFLRPNWEPLFIRLTFGFAALMIFVPPLAEMLEKGFAFQVVRRIVAEGREPSLPEVIDWRQVLRDGFRWWLVSLVFGLPGFLILAGTAAWIFGRYGLPESTFSGWGGWTEGRAVLFLGIGMAFLLWAVCGWLSNAAVMHMARRGSLRSAFAVRAWGRLLLGSLGGFLSAFFSLFAFGFVLGIFQWVVSIPAALLIIGPALAAAFFSIYHRLISAAVYAIAYRGGVEALALREHEV